MFARREAKTRIRQRDWLKLAGEKIRHEQVGSVPTLFVGSREQIRLVENGLKTRVIFARKNSLVLSSAPNEYATWDFEDYLSKYSKEPKI